MSQLIATARVAESSTGGMEMPLGDPIVSTARSEADVWEKQRIVRALYRPEPAGNQDMLS